MPYLNGIWVSDSAYGGDFQQNYNNIQPYTPVQVAPLTQIGSDLNNPSRTTRSVAVGGEQNTGAYNPQITSSVSTGSGETNVTGSGTSSGTSSTSNVQTGTSQSAGSQTGTQNTTSTWTPNASPAPTVMGGSFNAPIYNEKDVAGIQQTLAAPQVRNLREALGAMNVQATDDNPNARRAMLRDALKGFGVGLDSVMGGAYGQALSAYGQKYNSQYSAALTSFQSAEQAKQNNFNATLEAWMKQGTTTSGTVSGQTNQSSGTTSSNANINTAENSSQQSSSQTNFTDKKNINNTYAPNGITASSTPSLSQSQTSGNWGNSSTNIGESVRL